MEIWKNIIQFEGYYQVSNYGNVRSVNRIVNYSDNRLRIYNSIAIKSHICGRGYNVIRLTKDKAKKTYNVHQLVAMAFLNHNPNGNKIVVDHIDNNKNNNHVSNLRLVSNIENIMRYHNSKKNQYGLQEG